MMRATLHIHPLGCKSSHCDIWILLAPQLFWSTCFLMTSQPVLGDYLNRNQTSNFHNFNKLYMHIFVHKWTLLLQAILHHQNPGNELRLHLDPHLSSPHLPGAQAILSKPLELQNLERPFQIPRGMCRQTETLSGGRCLKDLGSRTMELVMEVKLLYLVVLNLIFLSMQVMNFSISNTGYGSNINYNSGYGSGMYSSYGGFGGSGGLYGNNNMYSGYGGGLYGNSGMNPGSMYNSGFGGPMGGYGMGMGGPYGNPDPNNPYGPPSSPPGFWISFIRVMQGVVNFFGRISVLIDQNTQAFHMFMSALLQLFDRSGLLYGELARFVLRLLGVKTRTRKHPHVGPGTPPGLDGNGQHYIEGPKAAGGSWDDAWGDDAKEAS